MFGTQGSLMLLDHKKQFSFFPSETLVNFWSFLFLLFNVESIIAGAGVHSF